MSSRAILWWSAALVAVPLALAIFVWTGFDRIPMRVRSAPEPAAQRDAFLALQRFTKVMGRPMTVSRDIGALDNLSAGGVLILGETREQVLTPTRLAHLLAWVEHGGHLVLPAVPGEHDPLQKLLEVRVVASPARKARPIEGDGTVALRVEGSERVLHAALPNSAYSLEAYGHAAPAWSAGNGGSVHLMHLRRGTGAVTLVWPWRALADNDDLGKADNAAVVWTLLNIVTHAGPVRYISDIEVPTLWQWLRTSAWAVLVSGALLIAVWLGRIVPRFGPLLPDPSTDRRALVEHLRAMGRAVWRAKEDEGLRYWLACVRGSVTARALTRDPGLMGLSNLEQARIISRRVGARAGAPDAQRVRIALAGDALSLEGGAAREGFTQVIAILQQVEELL